MRRLLILCATILAFVSTRPAWAILVFERGRDEPTVGYFVSEDAQSMVIEQEDEHGKRHRVTIRKSNIEDVLRAVSEQRLAALQPEKPAGYRDYAEELAEKKRDPDAHATSMRLFLIAAHLDPENLGRSSLLGMINLARHPREERRLRALAYLMDPNHDRRFLQAGEGSRPAPNLNEEHRQVLLQALQAKRRGDTRMIENLARRPILQEAFEALDDDLTYQQFSQMSQDLQPAELLALVRLELRLTGERQGADPTPSPAGTWSQLVKHGATEPTRAVSFDSLAPFDPEKCVYRDGQWQRPGIPD